jgi:putative redox protein
MQIEIKRLDDAFHFEAIGPSAFPIHMDAAAEIGGHGQGARPMELVAMALAGCAVFDFILILKKQRQILDDIQILVETERIKDRTPSPYENIHLLFKLQGQLDPKKVEKALSLSIEKYCSVAEMVKSTAEITYSFEINERIDAQ